MAKGFLNRLNDVQKTMKRVPKIVSAEAVRFSKERFRQTNWIGDFTDTWKKRKPGWVTDSKKRKNRNVLTDTGRLRRSIRPISTSPEKVVIGTDVPYARIHNTGGRYRISQRVRSYSRKIKSGGTTTVRSHNRTININMPRRQFIGESQYLTRRLIRIVSAEFNKALK